MLWDGGASSSRRLDGPAFPMQGCLSSPEPSDSHPRMTEIAFTTRDSGGLCHIATLRSGHTLRRHPVHPGAWLCDEAGPGATRSLIRLVRDLVRLPVVAAAYGSAPYGRSVEARVLQDLRAEHGLRFLWTFCLHGDGIRVHDELDDPAAGRYRFALEGGRHLPLRHDGSDATVAAWFGLGSDPDDLRRAYGAAAFAVHALNLQLGTRHNTLVSDPRRLAQVPRRPWRILETEDQLFINDAYDREIMSLRTAACQPLQRVSPEAARAADMLVRSVNALTYSGA